MLRPHLFFPKQIELTRALGVAEPVSCDEMKQLAGHYFYKAPRNAVVKKYTAANTVLKG